MAKPSITSTKAPPKTAVWTPPKTTWHLDDEWDQAVAAGLGGEALTDAQIAALVGKLNVPEEPVHTELGTYDYVFFGVNGGENETVYGKSAKSGVIVTGNGKDTVFGGEKGDLVFAGNGKDEVHGGGGNDIIFGENGDDQIWGDADTGTASYAPGDGGQVKVELGEKIADGSIGDGFGKYIGNGDYQDNQGSLQKAGYYEDGGKLYQVFGFDPGDENPFNELNSIEAWVYLYSDGFTNPQLLGHWSVAENKTVYFSVDLEANPNGGHVVVFNGQPSVDDLAHPQGGAWLKTQAFDKLSDLFDEGQGHLSFAAGDQLVGGEGADTFHWDGSIANNVDLIWDFNALDGDTLVISNSGLTLADLTAANSGHVFKYDLDEDAATADDIVIYIGENQAIGLVGVHDINDIVLNITLLS